MTPNNPRPPDSDDWLYLTVAIGIAVYLIVITAIIL